MIFPSTVPTYDLAKYRIFFNTNNRKWGVTDKWLASLIAYIIESWREGETSYSTGSLALPWKVSTILIEIMKSEVN